MHEMAALPLKSDTYPGRLPLREHSGGVHGCNPPALVRVIGRQRAADDPVLAALDEHRLWAAELSYRNRLPRPR